MAGGIGTALAAILSLGWQFDARYAHSEDVRQQIGDVKRLYLESERRFLKQREFELRNARTQRKLTDLERQRLDEVQNEIKKVDDELYAIPSIRPSGKP